MVRMINQIRLHSSSNADSKNELANIPVTFELSSGEQVKVMAKPGENLMSLAHRNDIELEGACEGSLACSTCHVILEPSLYSKLEEPSDEENDMLDLAFGLTSTSRLGCQVKASTEWLSSSSSSSVRVKIPSVTRNMAVDGYKPPKH